MASSIGQPSSLPPQTGVTQAEAGRQQKVETASVVRPEIAASGRSEPVQQSQQPAPPSTDDLVSATRDITDYIQSVSRSLQISVDNDLGTTVIRVMDADTEELVRQIPAEEILQLARFLSEQQSSKESTDPLRGLLVDREG